jgi:hypothetical protein
MKIKFSGSVHYANGDPISNVAVRIFDKDAAGKGDDDLTVSPGLSDEYGRFSLTYEPLRYLDYHSLQFPGKAVQPANSGAEDHGLRIPDLGDIYLPYLRFTYPFHNSTYEHTASLGLFQHQFYLPVNPPVEFLPSRHGFMFRNSFSGYFLPYSTPAFLSSRKVTSGYGLCGGMCAAAYDFLLVGRGIPQNMEVPRQGTRLQRYLFQRQMDSLGGLGEALVKVAQWTSLPDGTTVGTMRRTADEFNLLHQKLDQGTLVVLALIYAQASTLKELAKLIFNNHQVLAYAYQQDNSAAVTIHVYDPNLPAQDDVDIHAEPVVVSEAASLAGAQTTMGLKCTQNVGGKFYKEIRGFFAMPYTPGKPPERI